MESTSARIRRIAGDLAAVFVLLIAIALLLLGAMAAAGLLGPTCHV